VDAGETDPTKADSDGDGISDGVEDTNKNGKVDAGETDPLKKDSDGDGIEDGVEDKDKDGQVDPGETDPTKKDSDNDGLDDGVEDKNKNGKVDTGETDPTKWDTDNGGEGDGSEVKNGRNPLNPADDFGGPDAGPGPDMGADATVPDAGMPDATMPDATMPDASVPDATMPDAGAPDGPLADATGPDQQTTDMGQPDGPSPDAGVPDAGPAEDVGAPDQGSQKEAGASADQGEDIFLFGGGGCSVGDGSGGGLLLAVGVLLLAGLRRRRRGRARRAGGSLLVVAGLLLVAGTASAQGPRVSLLNFQPAAGPDNIYVTETGEIPKHLSPAAAILLSYAHRPLQLYNVATERNVRDVVSYQLNFDLMLAMGLWDRVEIGVGLPATLAQDSDGLDGFGRGAGASLSGGIGDIRLVPKGRIATVGPVSFAVALPITFPTGSKEDFLGDDTVTFTPKAVISLAMNRVNAGINVGYRIRGERSFQVPGTANNVVVDDELVMSAGVRVEAWKGVMDVLADTYLSLAIEEQDKEEVPAELLLGARFNVYKGLRAHLGGGPGLTRGVGTPVFRVFAGVSYQYMHEPAPEPPPAPVEKDSDGDGLLDSADKCPNEPEDRDSFEDEDGCPDKDNDGILDAADKCPLKPEDKDKFQDEDGCPDPDNDNDGILDTADKCPLEAEDKDKWRDEDGCPDTDNDADFILDRDDKCPNDPETVNGVDDEDGCPDKGKGPVQITRTEIKVPPVYFATNKDKILRRSFSTLNLVADLLEKNKWVKKVQIQGHTDDRGGDEFNMDLSRRRARSVMVFLGARGIALDRMEALGFGETRPIASNKSRRGRGKNRRVDFIIVDPAQPTKESTK